MGRVKEMFLYGVNKRLTDDKIMMKCVAHCYSVGLKVVGLNIEDASSKLSCMIAF
jgi:hypothetical protein